MKAEKAALCMGQKRRKMPSVSARRGMESNMGHDERCECYTQPKCTYAVERPGIKNVIGKGLREGFWGAEFGIKLGKRQIFGKAVLEQLLLQACEKGLTLSAPAWKPIANPSTVLPNDAITHDSYPLTRF